MKLGLLVLAATAALGCVPLPESTGEITYVCTSRNAHALCTHYEERDTTAPSLRPLEDEQAREAAYREGRPFFPSEAPGETPERYLQRVQEERRREDAYRKGETFLPDHQPGESPEVYLRRVEVEKRRREEYRKGGP